jgi:O-antigen ligase
MILSLFFTSKSKIFKIISLFFLLVAFIATVTSGSRGAIVSIFSGIFFFLIFYNSHNYSKIQLFFLVLIFIAAIIPFSSIFDSFFRESVYEGSTGTRFFLYLESLNLFLENPLFGLGWDYTITRYSYTTHSGWLQLLTELGILGFIIEFLIFYKLYMRFKETKNYLNTHQKKDLSILNLCIYSSIFSFFIWMFFENFSLALGTRIIYILIALYIISSNLSFKFRLNKTTEK